jgi:hypothetical protein
MSNGYAIAAVTRTLHNLLTGATPDVSLKPLDKARDAAAADTQLNLFLYNTPLAAAFRNSDPADLRPGESGAPPLPLTLHYLVTAYGPDEDQAHEVLGLAMSILHDHTLLGAQEILDANNQHNPSGLDQQVERVKITPLPLSTHDMFELWSGFATNYRVSAAYEASVVLIDSTTKPRAPLPVLQRGPVAITGTDAVLTAALPPERATVATLGATVRVLGSNLAPVSGFELSNPRWAKPRQLPAIHASDQECGVELPGDAAAAKTWPAGFYQLRAVTDRPTVPRVVSNSVPMGLGPTIEVTSPAAPVNAGEVTVTVKCRPRIAPGQQVRMLLGSASAAPTDISTPADPNDYSNVTAKFIVVDAGAYTVRLRVDRVDSDPVRYAGTPPAPQFDPAAQVVVQ